MTNPEPSQAPPNLILHTVDATAELLGVNKSLIYREIHAGHLSAVRIGRRFVRISEQAIQAYLQASSASFAPATDEDDNAPERPAPTSPHRNGFRAGQR